MCSQDFGGLESCFWYLNVPFLCVYCIKITSSRLSLNYIWPVVQTQINIKQQSAKNICPTAQVRAVTSKLEQSFNSSCGLLGPHSYSSHSSISVPINSESEGPENSETGRNKTGNLSKIGMYIHFFIISIILTFVYTWKNFQCSFVHVTLLQNNRDYLNVVYN